MIQIFNRVQDDMQMQSVNCYGYQYTNYYPTAYENNETIEVPDAPLVDLDFFMNGEAKLPAPEANLDKPTVTDVAKKRKTRKKKTENGVEMVTPGSVFDGDGNGTGSGELAMAQSTVPYLSTYADNCAQLDEAIAEINDMSMGVRQDINTIRSSKTIRNKYNYLSNLVGAQSGLISSKIQAIKEKNKCVNDSNNLDLKRMQAVNQMGLNQADDNKILTDLYTAYTQMNTGVNAMPMGGNPFGYPTSIDATAAGSGIVRSSIDAKPLELGYTGYMEAPNASQAAVQASMNPNIQSVVIYNPTAPRHAQVRFDVIDITTGQSVPNIERPHPSLLEDIEIQQDAGLAVSINMGKTYPLIVEGNSMVSQY